MTNRFQVAHHEASHAVMAIYYGVGVTDAGINLDAPSSVEGTYGHAGVYTFDLSYSSDESLMNDLAVNLAIICAGAASDAKLTGDLPHDALLKQPGDLAVARQMASAYPDLGTAPDYWEPIDVGLELAVRKLNKDQIWDVVQSVAQACLAAPNGQLSAADIRDLVGSSLQNMG